MSMAGWDQKVFRLRQLPNWTCTPVKAAGLIGPALGLPVDHVTVYSVAKSSDIWEAAPTRVATIQLKSLPRIVERSMASREWSFPIPASPETERDQVQVLILDSHFEGMTVDQGCHPQVIARRSNYCLRLQLDINRKQVVPVHRRYRPNLDITAQVWRMEPPIIKANHPDG